MDDYFTPYLTVTAILTVAKIDPVRADLAVNRFRIFAAKFPQNSAKHHAWCGIGLPVLEGSIAYLRGNYAQAASRLKFVHNKTIAMGHSDEQRAIFTEMYQIAQRRCSKL